MDLSLYYILFYYYIYIYIYIYVYIICIYMYIYIYMYRPYSKVQRILMNFEKMDKLNENLYLGKTKLRTNELITERSQ